MKDKIRLGLYGSNGHQIKHKLTDHPDAELVAVSKLSAAAMENLPETVRVYESLDDMIRDPDIDAVSLCSPMRSEQGRDALSEHVILTTFDGSVEPYASYKYGKDYFLGDIVTVRNEYGIETSARITEVIESFDENGYTLIPTFEYEEV